MAERVPARLTAVRQGRRFGLTVGVAFGALAALFVWRDHSTLAAIAGSLAGALVLGGLIVPAQLLPVERIWMAFAAQLSKVTTPILMAVVYYVVIMPIGLGLRVVGRNPLTPSESDGSFWIPRTRHADRRGAMDRQF